MKLFKALILICIFQFAIPVNAQDHLPIAKTYNGTSIGLGLGQDFGGIGVGVLHYVHNYDAGIFGGIGYTPAGIGVNGGLKVRLVSSKNNALVTPFILAMYGYTTAVSISNDASFNKIFYGTTLGIGLDLKKRKTSRGFWTLALLMPLDNSEANTYIQYLKVERQMTFPTEQTSIRYSIGYRYLLN